MALMQAPRTGALAPMGVGAARHTVVRLRVALSTSMYNIIHYSIIQHGGPPADGGHPDGRRTPRRAAGRWAFRQALHYGWAYMLTLQAWEKEDTKEEAVPWELGNIKFQVG
jgi:hypothetical protein